MKLRKDDPIYYRDKINDLLKQAMIEGLELAVNILDNGVEVCFIASNGDIASITLKDN